MLRAALHIWRICNHNTVIFAIYLENKITHNILIDSELVDRCSGLWGKLAFMNQKVLSSIYGVLLLINLKI